RIALLGFSLDPPEPKRGDKVVVKFFWSAQKPINEDYQVFVHADALGGNARRIHGDHFPAKGKYPTDVWRDGEIIVDPFDLDIPTWLSAPPYIIFCSSAAAPWSPASKVFFARFTPAIAWPTPGMA